VLLVPPSGLGDGEGAVAVSSGDSPPPVDGAQVYLAEERGWLAAFQVDDALYSNNRLDRGHIARRADLLWGTREEAEAAGAPQVTFAAKRLRGEWLIVVSNQPARAALDGEYERDTLEPLTRVVVDREA